MCGSEFKIRQQTRGNYCSNRCLAASLKGKPRIGYKRTKKLASIKNCEVCSNEFKTYRRTQRYCSSACFGVSCSREKHHNWRGGVGRDNLTPGYRAWRKSVIIRDGGRCRWCDSLNIRQYSNLEVHHIIPFSVDQSICLEQDNGITLCREHHNLTRGRENEYATFLSGLIGIELKSSPQPNRKDRKPLNVSRDVLYNLYWIDNLGTEKIGAIFGVTGACVLKCMKRFGIPRRLPGPPIVAEDLDLWQ